MELCPIMGYIFKVSILDCKYNNIKVIKSQKGEFAHDNKKTA